MTTRDETLIQQTHKGCETDARRVFYTLHDGKDSQPHRNSKLLAVLIEHLVKRDLISQDELDELLLECIN